MTQQMSRLRPELGDFSSIIFLKAILIGIEQALGDKTAAIAMISAGRNQGRIFARDLNLVGNKAFLSLEQIQNNINLVLGKEGTRLCLIDKIEQQGDIYKVYAKETFCSAGEVEGSSRTCTYTLGVIQGFLEALLEKRLYGKQTESVLRGGTHDVLEFCSIA
ncbi:hypothetical protein DP113_10395 [Brasilonema octagenarum UFV-E1]|uniref:Hydrocarbon-binding protein n=2 Tax=Brasilonema TaxID=383614 RepID=A0A856MSJ7_9CYAN|nr:MULTISPECIES: hypothetical protein [Brasilonema]NMF65218.1 hypothetical protein [Brasilonema octagenarum UFV-OR1]QDL12186.1 hypothetical protein DP114_10450 [Brasilonema sennae CENA114]QDL18566.1 hypothetical protein DP113_10395 [Brasilonema octagenarum UFV-E1]